MMISEEMTNSQTLGPCQVRDLSESWGEGADKLEKGVVQTCSSTPGSVALPRCLLYPITPVIEPLSTARRVGGVVTRFIFPLLSLHSGANGSQATVDAWVGARFPRVMGSTPSTVTYGAKYRPAYSTPVLWRLNTVARYKCCGL